MGLAVTPARADCAADIKAAEAELAKVTDSGKKQMVMKDIDMAKKAMADKKEADCSKAAMMAKDGAMKK